MSTCERNTPMRLVVSIALLLVGLGCSPKYPEYLVIVHDDFYTSVLPLVQAKQADSLSVKVIKVSDIGASPIEGSSINKTSGRTREPRSP